MRMLNALTVESDVLIAILKLTKEGPVLYETINEHVSFPSNGVKELLQKLQNGGLVYVRDKMLEVTMLQRLELAIRALSNGADLEKVSSLLHWKEFEAIAAIAFENNGYSVTKNLRFKHDGRRYEIDVVGCKKPLVVCVDCKRWHHSIGSATMERIANEQIARVRALVGSLPVLKIQLEIQSWKSARFVPVVLSLVVDKSKFCSGVPVVPILQVQDFLNQLPVYAESMLHIDLETRRQTYFSAEARS
jgi:Holliday junction resolvase-like predicted endonuclease